MKKLFCLSIILFGFIAANAQNDSLQHFVGKYKFPDGSAVPDVAVTLDNGILSGSSALGTAEFRPTTTADVFEIVNFGGTATFRRKEGKIIGVQILVGDVSMEGTKTEGP